ncbi:reverse transcriptase [Trichonephila clavipes]|nr:reverse transcriptase [Trichonephila clavipes]
MNTDVQHRDSRLSLLLSRAELLVKKHQLPLLMTRRALMQFYCAVATALPSKRHNLTNTTANKADAIPEELKSCALETIEQRYPAKEWHHIYTDDSYLPETNGSGVGWFYRLFEGSLAVGKNATNYDGEVLAFCGATTKLLSAGLASEKVVFFIDSQATILALSYNTPTECLNTIQCRTKITELILYGWTVALQWVSSHLGVSGNESRPRGQAGSRVIPTGSPLDSPKSIISTSIDKYTALTQKTKSLRKPWETLATVDPIPRYVERAEVVAHFRLTTGHDFLGVYLHCLSVAANEACPLCGHARMDGDYLLQCTGLDEYPANDIVRRY